MKPGNVGHSDLRIFAPGAGAASSDGNTLGKGRQERIAKTAL
jgi:hypothetical protein